MRGHNNSIVWHQYNRFYLCPSCFVLIVQKYKDVAVDAATFDKLKKDGTLNFGVLPVLKHGAQIIEQRWVADGFVL
jgi:hypothetical protein